MTEYKAIAIKEKPKSLGEKGVVKLLFIWDEEKMNGFVNLMRQDLKQRNVSLRQITPK